MGSVYVLSNPSLHGQLKVGFTLNSVGERLGKLNSSTSIPTKFVIEYYVELKDSETYKIEQAAHSELERRGHHHGKEFFRCTVDDCKNALAKAIANHNAIVLHAEDAEITRAKVAREKERIQAEQAQLTRAAMLERTLSDAEQIIKDRYQVVLDKIADPGPFLNWWLALSAVSAILIDWGFARGINGSGFVLASVVGAAAAQFARVYLEGERRQSSEYLTKTLERDAEVAAVRTKPTFFQPNLGATKSNFQFGNDEMRGPMHRFPFVPAEGLPGTPAKASQPKSSVLISERTDRAVHGRSAFAEPTNKASQGKSDQSETLTRAEWVFDSAIGQLGETKTGIVFGPSQHSRNNQGCRVLLPKQADLKEVNFLNGDHPSRKNPLVWKDELAAALLRGMECLSGRQALKTAVCHSSNAAINSTQTPSLEHANVATYITNKNRQEVEKLPRYFASQVSLEHTQTQRTTWANVGHAFSLQEVEVWGQDLAECVARQQSRTHWKLQRKLDDVPFLQTAASASNTKFFDAFGTELVDFCAVVAEKYIQTFGLEFDSPFSENVSIKEDMDNFGEDLVQMIDLVAAGTFARSRLTALGLELPAITEEEEEEEQEPRRAALMLPDGAIDLIALREFAGSLNAQTEDRRDVKGGLWVLEQELKDYDSENEKERKLKRHDEFAEVLAAAGFKWSKVRHGWFVH